MAAKFEKGQKVVGRKVKKKHLSPRDSSLEPYEGFYIIGFIIWVIREFRKIEQRSQSIEGK